MRIFAQYISNRAFSTALFILKRCAGFFSDTPHCNLHFINHIRHQALRNIFHAHASQDRSCLRQQEPEPHPSCYLGALIHKPLIEHIAQIRHFLRASLQASFTFAIDVGDTIPRGNAAIPVAWALAHACIIIFHPISVYSHYPFLLPIPCFLSFR